MRQPSKGLDKESELIAKARSGDERAIEALVLRFQDRVFTLAMRLARSKEEAEDITQEAFIKVLNGLPTFRGEAGFFTWLYRITVNLARDRFRSGSQQLWRNSTESVPIDLPDRAPCPERSLALKQDLQRLEAALARLGPDLREAFVLRHVEGLSYDEMAEILEAPADALKMRVHRARKMLRLLMEQNHASGT